MESQLATNPRSIVKPQLLQPASPIEAPGCGTERYPALASGCPWGSANTAEPWEQNCEV